VEEGGKRKKKRTELTWFYMTTPAVQGAQGVTHVWLIGKPRVGVPVENFRRKVGQGAR